VKRTLILAAALTALLTGCSGSSNSTVGQEPTPTPTPSPTPSPTPTLAQACTTGPATDLTRKPTYAIPSAPAPAETTTKDLVVGAGEPAKSGQSVTVKYVGVNYATGEEFDSSWKRGCDQTFPFEIGGNVIPGFSTGVTGMQVGGRRLVVIPPKDGYGDQGPVPGGTLAFIIDLVAIG
jgi:hypothetical protein